MNVRLHLLWKRLVATGNQSFCIICCPEPRRYSEIRKAIPAITEKMLIQHLKQLEEDGILLRKAKPVVPPFVTYSLTPSGLKLKPILYHMVVWAFENRGRNAKAPYKNLADFPG